MRERTQRFDSRQNMHSATFEIFHYKEPRRDDVEVHHHDFYEVYCFLGGEVEYWVEGRLYHLQPGDLLLINPMELHRPIVKQGCPVYERIVLWIDKEYLERLSSPEVCLTRCFDSSQPNHTNLLRPGQTQRSDIMTRLSELISESYGTEFGGKLCADGIFLQLMVKLNRMQSSVPVRQQDNAGTGTLVSRVLDHINEHYAEELSLETLSKQFFVSKYHLSHEFSREVGTSVYRYIMLKRLMTAKQMLINGKTPGEASRSCGFRDYTNFFRAFKAEYGVSPGVCASGEGNV